MNYQQILVTGGTGSFGHKFIETLLARYPQVKRLVIYSRDELKQYEMQKRWPKSDYPQLRFFIGDVRDASRLSRACEGVELIIHAAALKQVPTAEYNPMECIKTNIFGAENVINAAIDNNVKQVIALSTDKAAAPINLYGATKLCSDKLFVAANNIRGSRNLKFSVVRYGNVLGSRGSVVPLFLSLKDHGFLPITDERMTRFNISLDQGVELVLKAVEVAWGGEIFVPKIPSYNIKDVARAVAPSAKHEIVGVRPGEKLHEVMITASDSLHTYDCGDYYVIAPTQPHWKIEDFVKTFGAKKVPDGFEYSSGHNDSWLNSDQLRTLIREQISPEL